MKFGAAPQDLRGHAASADPTNGGRAAISLVVAPQHPDDDALHPAPIGVDVAWLHRLIRRLQADLGSLLIEALEGRLAAVEEGDDLLAVAGVFAPFDDDEIAVAQVIVDHAVAAHAQ